MCVHVCACVFACTWVGRPEVNIWSLSLSLPSSRSLRKVLSLHLELAVWLIGPRHQLQAPVPGTDTTGAHLCPITPMSRAHLCPVHILKTLTQDLLLVLHALPTHLPPRPPIFKEKKQEKYYLHVREDNSVHNFKHFQFKSKQKVTALLRSDSQAISLPFPPHVKCISKWISEYPQLCN